MSATPAVAPGTVAERRLPAAIAIALSALLAIAMLAFVPLSPASAATGPGPAIAASSFSITCPGTTLRNPALGEGAVADLTRVSGKRLADYNAGHAVPLYDFDGFNTQPYPPLCGVHYDAATDAPVAEWMFCTDLKAKVCGETNAAGELIERHPVNGVSTETIVGAMESQVGNARLTSEQSRIIAYLIRNGHSYAGIGSQTWGGVTNAVSNATSNERAALQTLIWCVSDAPAAPSGSGLFETCQANMGTAEMARILALTPESPALTLNFDTATQTVAAGGTARVTLTTNVYEQPITLNSTPAGAVTVCPDGGDATISGSTLTAHGTSSSATSFTLCLSSAQAGSVALSASATPASTEHINWNQSAVVDGSIVCQHFASFDTNRAAPLSNTAAVLFAVAPTPTPTPTPTLTPTPEPIVEPVTEPTPDPEAPVTEVPAEPSPASIAPTDAATVPSANTPIASNSVVAAGTQTLASTGVELTVGFVLAIVAIVLGTLGMVLLPQHHRTRSAHRAAVRSRRRA